MEGRVERPQIGHERERIVAFVGAEREAPRARRTIIAFSGLALRVAVGLREVRGDHEPLRVPISACLDVNFLQLSPSFWFRSIWSIRARRNINLSAKFSHRGGS